MPKVKRLFFAPSSGPEPEALNFTFYNKFENTWVNQDSSLSPEAVAIKYRLYLLKALDHRIQKLNNKAEALKEAPEKEWTKDCCNTLIKLTEQYRKNEIGADEYKNKTTALIDNAHTILDKYSGWKHLLINIAFIIGSICTCGLLYGAVAQYQGTFFPSLYPLPKDSFEHTLNTIEESVVEVVHPEPSFK